MVPLTMLSASCDADTDANHVTEQNIHGLHFNLHTLRTVVVPLMMPLAPCNAGVNASGVS